MSSHRGGHSKFVEHCGFVACARGGRGSGDFSRAILCGQMSRQHFADTRGQPPLRLVVANRDFLIRLHDEDEMFFH